MSRPPHDARSPESIAGEAAASWSHFDLVVAPTRSWVPLRLREVWAYRELLYFLAWRDLKVRYRQTVLGAAWALIQPLFTMGVFSLFFGRLGGLNQKIDAGVPYPLFALCGLVPWTFFAQGLAGAADSLVGSAHLITKVYFPRLVVPLARVVTGLVDFAIAFLVLLGLMAWFHRWPTAALLWLPALLGLALVTALGVGLWLSALNVQFRDVRHTLGFLTQFWMLATPIAYPSSLLPEPWRALYGLNPMAGVVEGFRWALLGTAAPGRLLWVSVLAALALLVSGAFYFRRMERTFSDRV
ncbi:MAG TPA: ABC transporter permease [Polyangia bacterium]|jgi:lipopolysaccharide transport system permease protein